MLLICHSNKDFKSKNNQWGIELLNYIEGIRIAGEKLNFCHQDSFNAADVRLIDQIDNYLKNKITSILVVASTSFAKEWEDKGLTESITKWKSTKKYVIYGNPVPFDLKGFIALNSPETSLHKFHGTPQKVQNDLLLKRFLIDVMKEGGITSGKTDTVQQDAISKEDNWEYLKCDREKQLVVARPVIKGSSKLLTFIVSGDEDHLPNRFVERLSKYECKDHHLLWSTLLNSSDVIDLVGFQDRLIKNLGIKSLEFNEIVKSSKFTNDEFKTGYFHFKIYIGDGKSEFIKEKEILSWLLQDYLVASDVNILNNLIIFIEIRYNSEYKKGAAKCKELVKFVKSINSDSIVLKPLHDIPYDKVEKWFIDYADEVPNKKNVIKEFQYIPSDLKWQNFFKRKDRLVDRMYYMNHLIPHLKKIIITKHHVQNQTNPK